MAQPVSIDIPGVGRVIAEGAASEATLRDILKAVGGKPGPSAGPGSGPSGAGSKVGGGIGGGIGGVLGGSVKLFGKGLMGAAAAVKTVGSASLSAAVGLTNLVQEFANVGDSMTNAAATMNHIPVVGGALAAVMGAVAGAAEKTLASYQAMSASGATFGGSLTAFASAAGGAGMTMDNFGKIVASNADAMQMLGGTTEAGAKRFAQLGKDMRNSKVGQELYALGMSTAEVNQGMASYIKTYGASGALQGKSTKELAQGAGQYLKELDGLAKITGQSRKALEDEQAARMMDAQFRAATANLDADQAKMMNNFISTFPKEQQAAVKEMIATGNITSEAGIQLNNAMPGLTQSVLAQGQAIRNGVKVSQNSYDGIYKSAVAEAKIRSKSEDARTQALYNSDQFGNAYLGMAELAKRDIAGKEKALTEQEKAQKSSIANMELFKGRLAELSNTFQVALVNSGVLASMMSLFEMMADIVMKFVVPAFQVVAAVIPKLVYGIELLLTPVIEAISDLMGGSMTSALQSLDAIMNTVFPILDASIRTAIMVFEGLFNGVKILFAPLEKLYTSIFGTSTSMTSFTDILLEAGSIVGGIFEFLSTILGAYIDVVADVINWFKGLVERSEWLTMIFKTLSDGMSKGWEALKLIFSAEGAKLLMFSIKDFFTRTLGSMIEQLGDAFMSMIDTILNSIPDALGGMSDEVKAKRDEERAARKDARESAKEVADGTKTELLQKAEAAKLAKDIEVKKHKTAVTLDSKAFNSKRSHLSSMGDLQKEEKDAKAAQVTDEKDYTNTVTLLQQQAVEQKSAFIKDVPGSATGGASAAVKQMYTDTNGKEQEYKTAAQLAAAAPGGKKEGTVTATQPAGAAQETPSTLLAALNTKIDALIRLNTIANDLDSKQLNAIQALGDDLFA